MIKKIFQLFLAMLFGMLIIVAVAPCLVLQKRRLLSHMRRYLALSGNAEIVYYSEYRLGSKANREDLEREIRQRYSARDAREILNSIDCVMRDYSD